MKISTKTDEGLELLNQIFQENMVKLTTRNHEDIPEGAILIKDTPYLLKLHEKDVDPDEVYKDRYSDEEETYTIQI